jgi:methionyl-tRNA synthetase
MAKYITTTLPYVNADPHIGFALEIVEADVIARAWRQTGEDVFFTTGTDEHGQKILQKAEAEGKPVQAYVDYFSHEVQKLKGALNLSYDAFIRTTDASHIAAAQELWKRCEAKGDIYKKKYTGLYCVGDEAFVKESDLVNGMCPNHAVPPIEVEEENYFFKFSAYQTALIEYLERETSIIPEWRRQEALTFVRGGLEDFSISRESSRMGWGIPVPADDTQVMYVWFDALTNYISTLGWPEDAEGTFKKFWTDGYVLQVAGKDQVRFQSLIWQAMLMSGDIKTTDQVFYHGFINSGGQKMSKSLGNVISPYELVEKYGTDATRYILLRHVHPTEDTDITWERLDEWYTANMVNGLGNLVARVMKLAESNLPGKIDFSAHDVAVDPDFTRAIHEFRFNDALDIIFACIAQSDLFMTENEPFKKVKSEDTAIQKEGIENIEHLVRQVAGIAAHLLGVMPKTAETILGAIAANTKPENLFPRIETK